MIKIAVHAHVYHLPVWDKVKTCLNVLCDKATCDIFITLPLERKHFSSVVQNAFPEAKILFVDNKGFDVAPFLFVLNTVDLDSYDFVVKLHTKREVLNSVISRGYLMQGERWCDTLMEFCSSNEKFSCAVRMFEKESVGMVGSGKLINASYATKSPRIATKARRIMAFLGLPIGEEEYISGTMFMVRAKLLKVLQNSVDITSFEVSCESRQDGSLAHIYERVFGCLVSAQGYTLEDFEGKTQYYASTEGIRTAICWLGRLMYDDRVNNKLERRIKILKIPVYRKALQMEV